MLNSANRAPSSTSSTSSSSLTSPYQNAIMPSNDLAAFNSNNSTSTQSQPPSSAPQSSVSNSSFAALSNGAGYPSLIKSSSSSSLMLIDNNMSRTNSLSTAATAGKQYGNEFKEEQETCLQLFDKWSPIEQLEFVENLLRRMCHFQHGHINNFLKPILQRDFISSLPGKF
jgi:hypothetical protein